MIAASTSGEIVCRTNVGNLYSAESDSGTVFLASEPRQFPDKLAETCKQIELNSSMSLRNPAEERGTIAVLDVSRQEVGMEGAQGLHLTDDQLDSSFSKHMTAIAGQAQEKARSLLRCTKCVLPATFPGISFDERF